MKHRARIFCFYALCDLVHVVDRARFVIYVHHGNERRFLVHKREQFFLVYASVLFQRRISRLGNSPVFQFCKRRENRGMFPRARHRVTAPRIAEYGSIVRFRTAGSERKIVRFFIRNIRHQFFPRFFQFALKREALFIRSRGIKIFFV